MDPRAIFFVTRSSFPSESGRAWRHLYTCQNYIVLISCGFPGNNTNFAVISQKKEEFQLFVVLFITMNFSESDDSFDYLFKVVLIGDAGVGKTCIVQRFKSGNFVERHGSTIGVDFTMKTVRVDNKKVKVSILTWIRLKYVSVKWLFYISSQESQIWKWIEL